MPDRRKFLKYMLAGLTVPTVTVNPAAFAANKESIDVDALMKQGHQGGVNYFTCGVVSGEPTPDAVVIWTRIEDPALIPVTSPYRSEPVDMQNVSGGGTHREWRKAPGANGDPESYSTIYLLDQLRTLDQGEKAKVGYHVYDGNGQLICEGKAETSTLRDYTLKLDVTGLQPGTVYFYRFSYKKTFSPLGRMKTLPAAGTTPDLVRFVAFSCQSYWQGYWNALHHVGQEQDVDFLLHLGDYIYEYGGDSVGDDANGVRCDPYPPESQNDPNPDGDLQEHLSLQTLSEYRFKYKYYRNEPNLQAAHRVAGMYSTWDDHEVRDDHTGDWFRRETEPVGSQVISKFDRLANAYYVYWEYMPIRRFGAAAPAGAKCDAREIVDVPSATTRLHRSHAIGGLIDLVILDGRQHRVSPGTEPAAAFTTRPAIYESEDRTNLGLEQLEWFKGELTASAARGTTWRMIANQTMVMPLRLTPSTPGFPSEFNQIPGREQFPMDSIPPVYVTLDSWDGFPVERQKILDFLSEQDLKNVVFMTGDIHMFFAGHCWQNFDAGLEPLTRVVGTEYVVSGISSAGLDDLEGHNGPVAPEKSTTRVAGKAARVSNPYYQYADTDCHGYGVFEVTPEKLTVTFKAVNTVRAPDIQSPIDTIAVFEQARDSNKVTVLQDNPPSVPQSVPAFQACPAPGQPAE